jgi:regulator of cell morphogenesis and NO signaling
MINATFSADHRRIDALLKGVGETLAGGMPAVQAEGPAFAERVRSAVAGLRRHIGWEEDLLFPAVENAMPDLAHGPGTVMRQEHREIEAALTRLEAWIGGGAQAEGIRAAQGELAGLEALLGEHNEKEEMVYYPLAEQVLGPDDAQRILDAMGAAG